MKLNHALTRAGWRVGMFGGVLVGGALATLISPTMTSAAVDGTPGAAPLVRILSPGSRLPSGQRAGGVTIDVSSLAR